MWWYSPEAPFSKRPEASMQSPTNSLLSPQIGEVARGSLPMKKNKMNGFSRNRLGWHECCYRKQETVSTWATGEANQGGEEENIATC